VTLDEYERAAARTINPSLDDADRLLDAAAGLAEEGGETLALVRKHRFQAHPLDRERLAKELGDALWCLAIVARSAGLSLEQVAAANVEKLRARYPDGFSEERSREREGE
jgi:NTP pyrophosphatase (non-canonical NTP hydrolase)